MCLCVACRPLQSTEEFIESYQCVQRIGPTNATHLNTVHNTTLFRDWSSTVEGDLPETMDWRTSGVVTKVKDQVCVY